MKILAGAYIASAGEINIDEVPFPISSPKDAIRA